MEDIKEFDDNRAKLREFIDQHVLRPLTQDQRDQMMGIADEGVRLELEVQRLRMIKAQVESEVGDVEELRAIRAAVAQLIQSGAYRMERAQGLWEGKSLAEVIARYLGRERRSLVTRLLHLLGRGVW
jgi:hypothetical protein